MKCGGLSSRAPWILLATVLVIVPCPLWHAVAGASEAKTTPRLLIGRVIDAQSREPLSEATVSLVEQGVHQISDDEGMFRFDPGDVSISSIHVTLIGYESAQISADSLALTGDTVIVTLTRAPIRMDSVFVEAAKPRDLEFDAQTPIEISGRLLNENLSATISATLANEPGMAQRTLGPAPARPVMRGLGGNRLLMIEDGQRVGDLSATSVDHAVPIDPINTSQIDVIRGAAALIYGSNVLGGVINVHRESVPRKITPRVQASVTTQVESVNSGATAGTHVSVPYGELTGQLTVSARTAGDVNTPIGELENSHIHTINGSGGGSWRPDWGLVGASVAHYESDYGVPGGFVGGHAQGVTIELERSRFDALAEVTNVSSAIGKLELGTTFNRYYHRELEPGGACGVSFGVLTYDMHMRAHIGSTPFSHPIVGWWAEYRDYAQGCLTFVPPVLERSLAGFLYDERHWSNWTFESALRVDFRDVSPSRTETNRSGTVRKREYLGVSAALTSRYKFSPAWSLALSTIHSFNPPSVEELFSDGPHLASFTYEVGNADLNAERSTGFEIGVLVEQPQWGFRLDAFVYESNDYMFATFTGDTIYGIGPDRRLEVFAFAGMDARHVGGELSGSVAVTSAIELSTAVSYVRGTLPTVPTPLPFIPPVTGRIAATYTGLNWTFSTSTRYATRQNRTGRFEQTTAGYAVFDLSIQRDFIVGRSLHQVVLSIDNVLDTEYRNHLSRVKDIIPEGGRNLRVFYKVSM